MGLNLKKLLLPILLICLAAAGCSNSSDKANEPKKLTTAQAQQVSQVLSNNKASKNAAVKILQLDKGVYTVSGDGVVDWENTIVSLNILMDGDKKTKLQTIQTKEIVYESYPAIQNIESLQGLTPRKWVQRPVTTDFAIDLISQYLLSLTADIPENPVLVQQGNMRFLGTKKIDGTNTNMYSQNENYIYYVNDDNELVRVDAKLPNFGVRLGFIFSDRGNQNISLPDESEYYPSSQVSKTYLDLRPKF